MKPRFSVDAVCLALVLASLLNAWVTEHLHSGVWVVCAVLAVSAIKCCAVVFGFMELHAESALWRWAFMAWIGGSAVLIALLYALAPRVG